MNYGSDNYSLLGELRNKKLSTSYDDQNPQMDTMADLNKSVPNDSWKTAAAQGAVQGGGAGISGMLMGGGLNAALMGAGPAGFGVAGAGLILSQIEAKQKAKQAQEQAIAAEAENRKAQTVSALNNLMRAGATVA
jgi:hypothetical protein